jgi:hypothetical protein
MFFHFSVDCRSYMKYVPRNGMRSILYQINKSMLPLELRKVERVHQNKSQQFH